MYDPPTQHPLDLPPLAEALVRMCIGDTPGADLTAEQWGATFAATMRHNVAPLVAYTVLGLGDAVPYSARLQAAAIMEQARHRYRLLSTATTGVLHFFEAHSIPTMLLKGLVLSRYYPRPELRSFSDIDIYLFGRHHEACRLVTDELRTPVDRRSHHHHKFTYGGTMVECHYDLINRHDHRGNAALERELKALAAAGATTVDCGGHPCTVPSATFTAVFLLRHAAAHFAAAGITLRHLTDWRAFCLAEAEGADWGVVEAMARRYGFLPFAGAVEGICHRLWGLDRHLPADDRHIAAVLQDILTPRHIEAPSHAPWPTMLRFKLRRYAASRWKHDLCYPAPWAVDLTYGVVAKLIKPYTIIH